MNRKPRQEEKRPVPTFATEAQEAQWWFDNRETHGGQLRAAVRSGEAQVLTPEMLHQRIETSAKRATLAISLRIPEADLALARKQAEAKGLPYQTYIKSLLHETLVAREKRMAKRTGA